FGRRGYDETQVDEFLEQVESALRTRSDGGPPPVLGVPHFRRPAIGLRGYANVEVDSFIDEIRRQHPDLFDVA
ncbi:MAG: DivIVA domain-containing protein, partial [Actinobacteria bacterium]|nr:DivIVA domain-containing protein [Actinomycetota bacterium]